MSRRLHSARRASHRHQLRKPVRSAASLHGWRRWLESTAPSAVVVAVVIAIAVTLVTISANAGATAGAQPLPGVAGTAASPQVHTVIDLKDSNLHPRQLAYDQQRKGIWFWTSTQSGGTTFDNRLYRYDIATKQLYAWPLYSGDWSSQILAGLALAPDGTVWVGWNHNLVVFNPQTNESTRFVLPAHPRAPLPAAVLGDLPSDLGIADLAIGRDGTVWIARYGALSLTAFSPSRKTFEEYPLPATAGDPAHVAIGPDGHVFFITNFSADHPGFSLERIGEFDPATRSTAVYAHGAQSLAVAPNGDLYTVLSGAGFGVSRLRSAERAQARAQHRAPTFERVVQNAIDDTSIAVDAHGQVWLSLARQPTLAVLNPQSNQMRTYHYAAAGVAQRGQTHQILPGTSSTYGAASAPGALALSHIAVMVTDDQDDLWYVRAGSSVIEEVTP